ncbi:ABC transporter substrate-binding protein [Anaerobium acetethylicum]|uniref:ABC-type branched-chain amino acid transport system, substrate-binding protein n=1 Tax=Anaerobium acetethylicum TaxID=1619234 RepID=A0A1D3TV52_9FIRM|nr:ABC transporter substrate-binding protein [Anaerobium acetethylicum]SCP97980.1 ABC-type branched-chain amino acid transport system, substrate-binding protein [Anaerobium acetethylicum]
MKKIIALTLSLLVLIGSLAGCGNSDGKGTTETKSTETTEAGTGKEYEPYKISMITQLTGDNTFGGNEYKNGAELAIKQLGGEINGRKIEMVFADGPTQEATLAEFERLYNNGSRAFVSGYGCIADRAFASMVDEMEATYLSLAWDADLIQGESDYFFRIGANVTDFAKGAIEQAAKIGEDYLKIPADELKVAFVYNTRLAHVMEPMKEKMAELGIEAVVFEGYPTDTKDFVPIITKMQSAEYDIFIPLQGVTDGTPFQKKMFELNYTPPVTFGAGVYYDTPIFAELGDDITNGIMTQSYTTPYIADDAAAGIKEFREEYEQIYGHAPLTHALQAYGGVYIYAKALESLDPADWDDTKKVAAAVKALDLDFGELPWYWGVKFDELNSNTRANQFITNQWIDGKLECVYPENLKTRDAIVPWK